MMMCLGTAQQGKIWGRRGGFFRGHNFEEEIH